MVFHVSTVRSSRTDLICRILLPNGVEATKLYLMIYINFILFAIPPSPSTSTATISPSFRNRFQNTDLYIYVYPFWVSVETLASYGAAFQRIAVVCRTWLPVLRATSSSVAGVPTMTFLRLFELFRRLQD